MVKQIPPPAWFLHLQQHNSRKPHLCSACPDRLLGGNCNTLLPLPLVLRWQFICQVTRSPPEGPYEVETRRVTAGNCCFVTVGAAPQAELPLSGRLSGPASPPGLPSFKASLPSNSSAAPHWGWPPAFSPSASPINSEDKCLVTGAPDSEHKTKQSYTYYLFYCILFA